MKINSLEDYQDLKTEIINIIYPVGSIYISIKDTDPSIFLGGTWERWGNGRSPLGVDETMFSAQYGDFSESEKTGGEIFHKLSAAEMPWHTHQYDRHNFWYGETAESTDVIGISNVAEGHRIINTTQAAGEGKEHNNMHPYITCYMWKRTK